MANNTCVCCGQIIPEGRQICPQCEDMDVPKYEPAEFFSAERQKKTGGNMTIGKAIDRLKKVRLFTWCGMDMKEAIEALISDEELNSWIRTTDRLPDEPGLYNVYLRASEKYSGEYISAEELSYVTTMYFNKGQALWQDGEDAYNAVYYDSQDYWVTHWKPLPRKPEEET